MFVIASLLIDDTLCYNEELVTVEDWLQPMLHRIKDDEFTVTYPVINGIDNKDFNIYQVEVYYHGLFNWVDLTYFPSPLTLSMMRKRKSTTAPIM